MAAKKKRPPRQVWLLTDKGTPVAPFLTKSKAVLMISSGHGDDVAGPYVLAERVRQK